MTAITVFVAQFLYIMLLGLQTQNVTGKHYLAAMANSLALGALGLTLASAIAINAVKGGSMTLVVAYLAAGPCGIASSMWLHPKLKRAKP